MNENPYQTLDDDVFDMEDDPTLPIEVDTHTLKEEQALTDTSDLSIEELKKLLDQKEKEKKEKTINEISIEITNLKQSIENWKQTIEERFKKLENIKEEETNNPSSMEERFITMKTFVYQAVSEIISNCNNGADIIKISNTANAILKKLDRY